MKIVKFAVLLLLLSNLASAQQSQEKVYNFTPSDPNKPVMLEVDIRYGKVIIQGAKTNNVEVVAKIRPLNEQELSNIKEHKNRYWKPEKKSNQPQRSREGLKAVKNATLDMQIEQQGNQIDITSEESTYYLELIVTVPHSTNIEADMYRGDGIVLSDIQGYLELQTWRGDIVAERINGPIVAETHQNAIVVSFAKFSSASPSSLATHSGDIDITVANKMAANISVQNYRGEILSGLDVPFTATEQVKHNKGKNRQEIVIGGQLTAKVKGGGQALTLSTYNGDVFIRKP